MQEEEIQVERARRSCMVVDLEPAILILVGMVCLLDTQLQGLTGRIFFSGILRDRTMNDLLMYITKKLLTKLSFLYIIIIKVTN